MAVAIGRYSDNIAIDLYEAQPAISTIGAGIGLWERTRNIVQHLGLDEEILAAATPPPPKDGQYHSSTTYAIKWLMWMNAAPLFSFRRADQPKEGYPFFRVIPPRMLNPFYYHRQASSNVLQIAPGLCIVPT